MSLQFQPHSLQPFNFTKIHPHSSSRTPFSIRVSTSTTSPLPSISLHSSPNSPSLFTTTPPPEIAEFRPTPELGLLSHLFVFSMVFGAFFSVALISIPTLIAFGKLGDSVKKLSKVYSEEVPGTLCSLKLSSLELNDLTQRLTTIRHKVSGFSIGKENGSSIRSRSFSKNSAS
ncbi:uncharacterized protein LOC127138604 [Lathyrus oleraceus]|uniref:Transmembrane protein n=1 Tax=Pisum sativum TaxID=3888 RepID=A0A9D5BDN5_PEA|nr:uncharacterized protein LOC127138604 [Pisum sativum]KAI5440900.1 hypothetical protein KIW84_010389 [Pisum sativum]